MRMTNTLHNFMYVYFKQEKDAAYEFYLLRFLFQMNALLSIRKKYISKQEELINIKHTSSMAFLCRFQDW